jgi:hypothetical protein
MAILTHNGNEVEVRIMKLADQSYYDEYVKIEGREDAASTTCQQYIVPEPGTTYAVEVNLKKGYVFGECDMIVVRLYMIKGKAEIQMSRARFQRPKDHKGNTEMDMRVILKKSRAFVDAKSYLTGAELFFKRLEVGKASTSIPGYLLRVWQNSNLNCRRSLVRGR